MQRIRGSTRMRYINLLLLTYLLTREQRGLWKTKNDTEVAHVTCDSDTTYKVKRSKVKVTRPLWLVVLAGQHRYTVMVTYPYAYMQYIVSPLQACRAAAYVAVARLQLVRNKIL